MTVKKW